MVTILSDLSLVHPFHPQVKFRQIVVCSTFCYSPSKIAPGSVHALDFNEPAENAIQSRKDYQSQNNSKTGSEKEELW
jgi:hypothetical protein